jgi:hypothetical protein
MIDNPKFKNMKSSKWLSTQWILSVLFVMGTTCGFAQNTITWKGGTPGMKNDWYCPQNWSSTSLPDEFSDVIIPDVSSSTFAPPYIKSGKIEINSLRLQSNALLTIDDHASLSVISYIEGFTSFKVNGGGQLILKEHQQATMIRLVAL